jgi:hypothetical protein
MRFELGNEFENKKRRGKKKLRKKRGIIIK